MNRATRSKPLARTAAWNGRPQRIRAIGVIAALVVTLVATAGCAGTGGSTDDTSGPGPTGRMVATGNTMKQTVPRVAATTGLVDQDGHRFSLRSMRGKVVVLAPVLTMCQETCPMTTANIHHAAEQARDSGLSGRVLFLELTVDPQRDTVRRLHAYAKLYGALSDWRVATGPAAHVEAMWHSLGVSTRKTKPDDTLRDWMTGRVVHHSYDVHHQDVVMVVDAAGRLRWITDGRPDAHGSHLPTSLKTFLNEEGQQNYAHPNAGGASSWTAHNVEQAVAYVRGLDT